MIRKQRVKIAVYALLILPTLLPLGCLPVQYGYPVDYCKGGMSSNEFVGIWILADECVSQVRQFTDFPTDKMVLRLNADGTCIASNVPQGNISKWPNDPGPKLLTTNWYWRLWHYEGQNIQRVDVQPSVAGYLAFRKDGELLLCTGLNQTGGVSMLPGIWLQKRMPNNAIQSTR